MKVLRVLSVALMCLSLTGCAEFIESLQPLAEEADKAINVIKDDIDNASQKIENGENVTWEDFKFITDNEVLNSSFKDFDIAKDRISEAVKEASAPIPYTETRTNSLDRASLNTAGSFITCMYLADNVCQQEGTNSVTEGEAVNDADSADTNSADKGAFCFFIYNTVDEVTYLYSKFLPNELKKEDLMQDSRNSEYAVNLVRIGAEWYIEAMGESATDIDSELIINSLKNYEKCLEVPSESTYKSGGLYNLLNMVSAEQNVINDIFARSDAENDYIVFTYNEETIMTITDVVNEYTYMIGQKVNN